MKLGELGEFGLIDRIRGLLGGQERAVIGVGDDCAAIEAPAGELLLTSTDLLIEGVHFRTDWSSWYDLGCKAVAVNCSDIAAMGGAPRALFLGLAAAPEQSVEGLEALLEGLRDEARRYDAELLGGDTCRSPGPLMLGVTVQGFVPREELVRRSGGDAGDLIWVSGTLGDSALALAQLQRGERPEEQSLLRHYRPTARVELGRALAQRGLAKAMIDISDGLLADLGHVAKASGVGAEIELAMIPLSPVLRRHAARDPETIGLALHGGEDYELLFCSPCEREAEVVALAKELGLVITCIGRLRSESGVGVAGLPEAALAAGGGFDHFAGPG